MKIFKHFNEKGKCYICGKNDDSDTTLIPIYGTNDGGLNYRAEQVHIKCLDLMIYPINNRDSIIVQLIDVNGKKH